MILLLSPPPPEARRSGNTRLGRRARWIFAALLLFGCTSMRDPELTGLRADNAQMHNELAAVKTVIEDNSTRNFDEWTLRLNAIRDGLVYLALALPGAYIGGKLIWLLAARGLKVLNGTRKG